MNMKATIRSGALAVLLGAATGTAALAQDDSRYGNGPAESTPAEVQQTDQLNQQSDNAAATDLATQTRFNEQYQDQQQQYQRQMQGYQEQQQRYNNDRQRYYRYLAAYGFAPYGWVYYP